MRRLIYAIKIAYAVYRKPETLQLSMLQIMEGIASMMARTANENRPFMSRVCIASIKDEKGQDFRLVSLWCGPGYGTPLERIEELAKENEMLKHDIASLTNQ